MALETASARTEATPVGFFETSDRPDTATLKAEVHQMRGMDKILLEQLAYLIQFADQERDRLERVKAVLMEPFN